MANRYTLPGSFKSAAAFAQHLQSIDEGFGCDEELLSDGPLAQPLELSPGPQAARQNITIGNRFAIHPMEGWDGTLDGQPSDHTLRRWKRFGESGAKLLWGGEAVAVEHEGRANPNQLYYNPHHDNVQKFSRLREAVLEGHQARGFETDDFLLGLQLTHSGRFSRPNGSKLESKIAFYHPLYDQKFGTTADLPLLSDDDLKRIRDHFIEAAVDAEKAGFGFVDIKSCHGYLLHELLAARTRPGPYGGSFENRTRLFREIVEGVVSRCPSLEIGIRLGLTDLPPHTGGPDGTGQPIAFQSYLPYELGFGMDRDDPMQHNFEESFQMLDLLRQYSIRLLNISIGTPYSSPHLQRPATYPPSDGYLPPMDPLVGVYDQIQSVRLVKERYPEFVVVGSGYSYLQDFLPHVAQYEVRQGYTDFVGLGRMVLSYPDLPSDVLQGRPLARKKICRTFSDCTTGPRNQMLSGCFPLDPYYKKMPEAVTIKELRRQTSQRLQSSGQPEQP